MAEILCKKKTNCVGFGGMNNYCHKNLVLSNELIKVELPP